MAENGAPPSKRARPNASPDSSTADRKDDATAATPSSSVHEELHTLDDFEMTAVLNENARAKKMFVRGRFAKRPGVDAVVLLEKPPFDRKQIEQVLADCKLKQRFRNDIYGTYTAYPAPENNSVDITLIHPATEFHIKKYTAEGMHLVSETKEDYETLTRPYIKDMESRMKIDWVYNILDHRAETDRIVFEDPDPNDGFVLLPDMKWNQEQLNDLYLIAIPHLRGLHSIRSLTGQHLPLLENILHKAKNETIQKYGIPASKLRMYLHYLPSYYHLHVHVTHLQFDAPGCQVERAHLLTTIIDNIKRDPSYYQNATLPILVAENNDLAKIYTKAGRLE